MKMPNQTAHTEPEFTVLADSLIPSEGELLAAANHHKQVATVFEDEQA